MISDVMREAFDLLADEYGHGGAAEVLQEFGVAAELTDALSEDFKRRKWS